MKKNLVLFLLSFVLIGFISCCKCDEEIDVVESNEIANTEWVNEKEGTTLQFSEKLVAFKVTNGNIIRILNYTYDDGKIFAEGVENTSGVRCSFTAGVVKGEKEHLLIRESNMAPYYFGEKYYKK
ncbi:MAG TPA: hypothetical protein PKV22_03220 [Paludibacteraceae bacterium]|jgi:hypothetical protein|nr:hypothetical protein [Dysgonamonadaceae bacterium]HOV36773.1 hypothetical protein [Dysgonamonadaceae bacterium]HQF11266.1 hypothetical protein [Paludibacteraceae bacterium]